MAYTWVPGSVLPQLLPWLGLLGLLLLPRNRQAAAWWIWVPVLAGFGLVELLRLMLPSGIPSGALDGIIDGLLGLNCGLAAVWLVAGHFANRHRVLSCLGMLLVLALFGSLTLVAGLTKGAGLEALQTAILVGAGSLVFSVALTLAGWLTRRQYRPVRLALVLLVALAVMWLLVIAPFATFAIVSSGGVVSIGEVILPFLVMTLVSFVAMLPFLLLSFATWFYRERLQQWLRLGLETSPPVLTPSPLATPAGA